MSGQGKVRLSEFPLLTGKGRSVNFVVFEDGSVNPADDAAREELSRLSKKRRTLILELAEGLARVSNDFVARQVADDEIAAHQPSLPFPEHARQPA